MTDFAAAGLGLQYGTVALVRADERWGAVAEILSDQIEEALAGVAQAVENIGSTSVRADNYDDCAYNHTTVAVAQSRAIGVATARACLHKTVLDCALSGGEPFSASRGVGSS